MLVIGHSNGKSLDNYINKPTYHEHVWYQVHYRQVQTLYRVTHLWKHIHIWCPCCRIHLHLGWAYPERNCQILLITSSTKYPSLVDHSLSMCSIRIITKYWHFSIITDMTDNLTFAFPNYPYVFVLFKAFSLTNLNVILCILFSCHFFSFLHSSCALQTVKYSNNC